MFKKTRVFPQSKQKTTFKITEKKVNKIVIFIHPNLIKSPKPRFLDFK